MKLKVALKERMRRKAVMQKKEIEFLFSTVEDRRLDIENKLNDANLVIKDMSETATMKDIMNNPNPKPNPKPKPKPN